MLSIELTEKAGLHLIGKIAKMPAQAARHHLEQMEVFTPDEITELLQVCKVQPVVTAKATDYFYARRRGMAALWMIGASWAQIGELYQVSRQTVMDGAHKVMGGERRRLATRCTYERLSEYNARFWTIVGTKEVDISELSILEIASFLSTTTEADV